MADLASRAAQRDGLPVDNPRDSFYHRNEQGLIELVCIKTGAVIAVQRGVDEIPRTEFARVMIDGREVLVQTGVDREKTGIKKKFPFSRALGDVVVQLIIEGTAMSKIGKTPGMPDLATIARWRRENSEFNEEIKFARQARAERLRDEMLEIADEAKGQPGEYVSGYKLAADARKWAAEKDSPEEYGSKIEVKGSLEATVLMVETGIRRHGDSGLAEPKDVTVAEDDSTTLDAEYVVDSGAPERREGTSPRIGADPPGDQ